MPRFNAPFRRHLLRPAITLAAALATASGAMAQTAPPPIDSDLVQPGAATQPPAAPVSPPTYPATYPSAPASPTLPGAPTLATPSAPVPPTDPTANPGYLNQANNTGLPSTQPLSNGCVANHGVDGTYSQDDLIGAAEGIFGKAAHGLADIIQDLLKKQGRPDGYIVGREGGGALVVGLRYGSGKLCSQIAGSQPVYWTGPSIGFDAGASAGNTFVLIYNLTKPDDLFHRFVAGEGQVYMLGGFHVSYLKHGQVVLIPARMGVGLRLGVNAGYMKFSHKQNWLPF